MSDLVKNLEAFRALTVFRDHFPKVIIKDALEPLKDNGIDFGCYFFDKKVERIVVGEAPKYYYPSDEEGTQLFKYPLSYYTPQHYLKILKNEEQLSFANIDWQLGGEFFFLYDLGVFDKYKEQFKPYEEEFSKYINGIRRQYWYFGFYSNSLGGIFMTKGASGEPSMELILICPLRSYAEKYILDELMSIRRPR